MTKLMILAAALAACTQQQDSTPLHALGDTTLEMVALGTINVEMKVKGADCVLLGEDVHALFDGHPMRVSRGGYAQTSDGCYPIAFSIDPQDMGAIVTYEQGVTGSNLIIEDASARWTVGSTRLFANQFTIDSANSRVVWQDVTQITSATLEPHVAFTISGNEIAYPPGTEILSVSAYAHPSTSRCDGPALCTVDLQGARDFKGQQN